VRELPVGLAVHYDLALPFLASAVAVLISTCSQAIMRSTVSKELEQQILQPALNLPGQGQEPIQRFLPSNMLPPFVLLKITRVFDGAQCLTVALSLVMAIVSLGESNTRLNVVAGLVFGSLSMVWFTLTIVLSDTTYVRFFHPKHLWIISFRRPIFRRVLFADNGWAWPSFVAFVCYVGLGTIAL